MFVAVFQHLESLYFRCDFLSEELARRRLVGNLNEMKTERQVGIEMCRGGNVVEVDFGATLFQLHFVRCRRWRIQHHQL
jgi:hypothetical protein